MNEVKVASDFLQPHKLYSPWNSLGQNTGIGSLSLLQGIFPTQGSYPGLPHCRWILYQLSSHRILISSVQSLSHACHTPSDPMDCSTPGFPVHQQLQELTQAHVLLVSDTIQPSHPMSSPSPAFHLAQHQGLFMSQLFTPGGQSIGASASASVLPMNIQD